MAGASWRFTGPRCGNRTTPAGASGIPTDDCQGTGGLSNHDGGLVVLGSDGSLDEHQVAAATQDFTAAGKDGAGCRAKKRDLGLHCDDVLVFEHGGSGGAAAGMVRHGHE